MEGKQIDEDAMRDQRIADALSVWFRSVARDLPWRKTKDPYLIWVSEVMLQQTRVETVIPYYNRFIERFPTVEALAQAPDEEALKYWEGLGYYRRLRHLVSATRELQEHYGNHVPRDAKTFASLPGVGEYTLGAVMSIANGQALPAVDGNVMRVLSRVDGFQEDLATAQARNYMKERAQTLVHLADPGEFNQALMELGATLCLPKNPQCDACPIAVECAGLREGIHLKLPIKRPKGAIPTREFVALAIRQGGRLAIEKRPAIGLLANLWQLPLVEHAYEQVAVQDAWIQDALSARGVKKPLELRDRGVYEHVFSHQKWRARLIEVHISSDECVTSCRMMSSEDRAPLPFARLFVRMLHDLEENSLELTFD
ncbi:A/G-specific adenine glycosylase [Ferroacidibacillus organovorans]|uniref:Adenine DNA glycosylase n=1 Tax=Ferroacidibacillus organovorans TaxID=1765683 RepID=A0A1V4EQN6_9BACL|nr:A/G-specific adenine glycosylase [Ferroacidibacillus organovorans]OPG15245.1 A/G-specific adenine glycosylase [Ferroacidibacillus organovorans]